MRHFVLAGVTYSRGGAELPFGDIFVGLYFFSDVAQFSCGLGLGLGGTCVLGHKKYRPQVQVDDRVKHGIDRPSHLTDGGALLGLETLQLPFNQRKVQVQVQVQDLDKMFSFLSASSARA